jgi:hypothetical protein
MFFRPEPFTLEYTLTREQFKVKQFELAKQGVDADDDTGTIKHMGITADYRYEEPKLAVDVKEHPLLLTENLIKQRADEWFQV